MGLPSRQGGSIEHLSHLLDGCLDVRWPARPEGLAEEDFGQRGAPGSVQIQVRERMQEIGSALLGDLYRN
jgi:hypothetical protein